ncbi:MAG: uracil-DNA glycosylase [Candidatus Cloacimonetes bacterium]|nr:uracil-DNA glycosylase [Candidatus Cloacimonadota bacterium]
MGLNQLKQYLEYLNLSGVEDVYISKRQLPDPAIRLAELEEAFRNCTKCELHQERDKFVYGEGNPQARMVLIGEGPGAEENATGKPFIGKAGQLLTKMLQAINIERDDVYITNVVKCRPPNNRNPLSSEVQSCLPYLDEQLEIISPQLLLLLGRVAAESLLELDQPLKSYRGQTHEYKGITTYVTYHPSALLRNPAWKKFAWVDLQKVRDHYQQLDV